MADWRRSVRDSMTLAWLIGLGVLINVVLTIIGLEILQLLGLWPIPESSPKT